MIKPVIAICLALLSAITLLKAQPCTALGNPATYGTGDVWLGYIYSNTNFTGYSGYITEGSAGNSNFDESFGTSSGNFVTNGCPVQAETFSARFRLRKTFTAGYYEFTVGADDGYRLSIDGGATWIIDHWADQSYGYTIFSTPLSGTYDLVLEYYENSGENRITFNVISSCTGTENTSQYGTGNVWRGYVYDNADFTNYKGMVLQGAAADASFDQDFGGSNVNFPTSGCSVQTETFSVRYRLRRSFASGAYLFTVKGDDGYRLSIDGGLTWLIDKWSAQSLLTTLLTLNLGGSYDMVLEYFENSGDNRVVFQSIPLIVLPVNLLSFMGEEQNGKGLLQWETALNSTAAKFIIEQSADATNFDAVATIPSTNAVTAATGKKYSTTVPPPGIGEYYYRLRMLDAAGNISYSNVVKIRFSGKQVPGIRVYPAIVDNGTFSVRSDKTLRKALITVSDIAGRRVLTLKGANIEAGSPLRIELPGRPAQGLYLVKVETEAGDAFVQKLLVR